MAPCTNGGGLESCGILCATEKYCKAVTDSIYADLLGVVVALSMILASGGTASPVAIIGLITGVVGLIEKIAHPHCTKLKLDIEFDIDSPPNDPEYLSNLKTFNVGLGEEPQEKQDEQDEKNTTEQLGSGSKGVEGVNAGIN